MTERITPKVTVDIIIEIQDWWPNNDELVNGIVLVERKNPPLGYALPGGFVDVGERCIEAAAREALEETGLRVTQLLQFHTYTSPDRDVRDHGISVVYIGKAIGAPKGADDAEDAFIVNPENMKWILEKLCFDHRQIITDYLVFKRTGVRPTNE